MTQAQNSMKLHKHIYWALRYGEWSWGWEMYPEKPQFGIFYTYYDGNIACFHLYKLWIEVEY